MPVTDERQWLSSTAYIAKMDDAQHVLALGCFTSMVHCKLTSSHSRKNELVYNMSRVNEQIMLSYDRF